VVILRKNIHQTTHWRVLELIFSSPRPACSGMADDGHDVGSEYALYMVGGA
jgi:hypothetical protein